MFYRNSCYALMVSAVTMTGNVSAQSVSGIDNDDKDNKVAVGYGTKDANSITSCITSVKMEALGKVTSVNALQALQARVPGLDIQQVSGEAGSDISILMRGYRSYMDGGSPLILVDGVEHYSIIDIPASEIESIDVLKDAASTAIYGAKGANGVVIVTTKHGKAGKINVNFGAYWSFNSSTAPVKGMYGQREVQRWADCYNYMNDLWTGNWGESAVTVPDFGNLCLEDGTLINDMVRNGDYTDWTDLILHNSVSQNYDVSVGGGSEKTNFNVALSLMDDRGMLKDDQFKRYRVRGNIDHAFNKLFKAGANVSYTYKDNDKRDGSVFSNAYKLTSLSHAYDSRTGEIIQTPDIWYASRVSPLQDEDGRYKHEVGTKHFFGNAYVQVTPFKGFVWKTQFNYDYSKTQKDLYRAADSMSQYIRQIITASKSNYSTAQCVLQNTADYKVTFNDKHYLGVMLGNEYTHYKYDEESLSAWAYSYANDEVLFVQTSDVSHGMSSYETMSKYSVLSFFGRVNYSYLNKYLFQATLRTDGYSVIDNSFFSADKKWYTFPSVSAAWRITEENFMKGTRLWLDNLKLRMSWGVSGNGLNNIESYYRNFAESYINSLTYSFSNIGNNIGYIQVPDLLCEKISTFDIGIDFSFLNGRLGASIDYYASKSSDLLYYKTNQVSSSSYMPILSNVGETKGHGFEMLLNAVPVLTKDFRWDVSASATFAKDEIVKLTDGVDKVVAANYAAIVGQPISIFYDYEVGNCWGVGEYEQYCADYKARTGKDFSAPTFQNYKDNKIGYGTPGTIKVIDRNDDGEINEQDKRVYQRSPKAILGMTNTFSYKNFTLSIQMMARLGGYIAYEKNNALGLDDGDANWADVNYWTLTNTATKFPSPSANTNEKSLYTTFKSTLLYEKADYFKIKDITLSYNLEKNWLKSLRMENASVYCSLKNFITINALDDCYDPERGGAISFPLAKQFVIGMNITF